MPAISSPRRSPTSASTSGRGSRPASSTTSPARSSPQHGGTSASKGYHGTYPAEICISPNSMVVHGIPGPYRVADGDLITIDVGVVLDGAIADSAYTFGVGSIDPEAQRLLDVVPGRARRRDRRGAARQPDRGHLASRSSPSSRAPASRSSAASSATASAATTTRIRTCRTSASRGGGRSSPRE